MNYPETVNCVCEKAPPATGSVPVQLEVPPIPEQLAYVAEQIGAMMELSSKISFFALGHGIGYEKRENNTLTGNLMWFCHSLQQLNDALREIDAKLR